MGLLDNIGYQLSHPGIDAANASASRPPGESGLLSKVKPYLDAYTGVADYQAQVDQLAWMKEAQERTWQREDTAYARKVADLKEAGLNPALALGGGSPTSAPVQMPAPRWGENNPIARGGGAIQGLMDLKAKQASIAQTQAQTEATNALADKTRAEARVVSGTAEYKIQVAAREAAQAVAEMPYAQSFADFHIDQVQWNALKAQAERANLDSMQEGIVAESRIKVLESEIKEQTKAGVIDTVQGNAMMAVAMGMMTKQSADWYQKLGLTKETVNMIMQAVGTIVGTTAGAAARAFLY